MAQTVILDDQYLGYRVRAELHKLGMSQAALARELDVTENFVSRRLRGEVPFTAVELATVAEVLDVGVEDLLSGPPTALERAS